MSPAGSSYKILYAFKGGRDGAFPEAGLTFFNGTLYGTASSSGKYGGGTAFGITPAGELQVLHAFGSTHDGRSPDAGLTIFNGALYGTTPLGGGDVSRGQGTVFILSTSGSEHVLYSFKCKGSCNDAAPLALTALNGRLYGTTTDGPANQDPGTVFSIATAGKEQLLYKFGGGSNGGYPMAGLTLLRGALYGTTTSGGGSGCSSGAGCGTVFKITASALSPFIMCSTARPLGVVRAAMAPSLGSCREQSRFWSRGAGGASWELVGCRA